MRFRHLCSQWINRRSSFAIGSLHQGCSRLTTCLAVTPMPSLCLHPPSSLSSNKSQIHILWQLSYAESSKHWQGSILFQDFRSSIVHAQNNTVLEVKGKMIYLMLQWSFHKCLVQTLERVCTKSGKEELRQLFTIKAKKVALWQW